MLKGISLGEALLGMLEQAPMGTSLTYFELEMQNNSGSV